MDAIIWIASASEFNHKCYEDDITNRFWEAHAVLEETFKSSFCQKIPCFLVLNKYDVFLKKMEKRVHPGLNEVFRGNQAPGEGPVLVDEWDPYDAIRYLAGQYTRCFENPNLRQIYLGNALDKKNTQMIYQSIS